MFQIRRMCFSNWSTVHNVIIKVWVSTAWSSKIGAATAIRF